MSSKNKKLLLGVLAVSLLYGCKTQNGEVFVEETKTQQKSEDIKTYTDSNEVIKIQKGEKFQIALESNPTTGYGWEFKTNTSLIVLIDQKFEAQSNLIGAGGVETFIFSTLNTGETEIVFSYKRSWEEEAIEEKVFKIEIL